METFETSEMVCCRIAKQQDDIPIVDDRNVLSLQSTWTEYI